mgnify:CR=1 FL=1
MNPDYKNEPDSDAAKIASGEKPLTEDIKNSVKEMLKSARTAKIVYFYEIIKKTYPQVIHILIHYICLF